MVMIASDEAMQAFGEKVGRAVLDGDVIELIGDVGAGKTTFVRGLARGMGVDEIVQSPSFTISRVYDETPAGLRLAHYDFYRLSDAGIMADELQETTNDPGVVTVIEWADIVAGVLPADRLTLTIASPSETSREVTSEACGPRSQRLQEVLA